MDAFYEEEDKLLEFEELCKEFPRFTNSTINALIHYADIWPNENDTDAELRMKAGKASIITLIQSINTNNKGKT